MFTVVRQSDRDWYAGNTTGVKEVRKFEVRHVEAEYLRKKIASHVIYTATQVISCMLCVKNTSRFNKIIQASLSLC